MDMSCITSQGSGVEFLKSLNKTKASFSWTEMVIEMYTVLLICAEQHKVQTLTLPVVI